MHFFVPFLLVLTLAAPAAALDFSGVSLALSEDFQGETSSPTSPEVDLLDAEGVFTEFGAVLTGTHADLSGNGAGVVADPAVSTAGSDLGFRFDFDDFTHTVDGQVLFWGIAELRGWGGSAPLVNLRFGLLASRTPGGVSVDLVLDETDGFNTLASTSVTLGPSKSADVFSGMAARVDAFIDHSAGTATAQLLLGGVAVATTPAITLTTYFDQILTRWDVGIFEISGAPASVDVTLLEVYADPLGWAPLYNIDVGSSAGVPSSSYGAAGQAGVWNQVGLGTSSLLGVHGNPSAATVTVTSENVDTGGGSSPNVNALLGDSAFDCTAAESWDMTLNGLPDGLYRLYIYAPSKDDTDTGALLVDAVLYGNLTGVNPPALVQGSSWERFVLILDGGVTSFGGLSSMVSCAGIAGVQLEIAQDVAPAVPSIGVSGLAALAGTLLLVGGLFSAPLRLRGAP